MRAAATPQQQLSTGSSGRQRQQWSAAAVIALKTTVQPFSLFIFMGDISIFGFERRSASSKTEKGGAVFCFLDETTKQNETPIFINLIQNPEPYFKTLSPVSKLRAPFQKPKKTLCKSQSERNHSEWKSV